MTQFKAALMYILLWKKIHYYPSSIITHKNLLTTPFITCITHVIVFLVTFCPSFKKTKYINHCLVLVQPRKTCPNISINWKSVCLTASFLATGGFLKLFHKIPWFFHDYSDFFNFHDFPCMELFFVVFQVFNDFKSSWEPCDWHFKG